MFIKMDQFIAAMQEHTLCEDVGRISVVTA
jgi:hypothetical protein